MVVTSCEVEKIEPPCKWFPMQISANVGNLLEETRIELYNSENDIREKTLTVYGWENDAQFVNGVSASFSDGKWSLPGPYVIKSSASYTYWAATASSCVTADKSGVTLTVEDIASCQEDILLGGYSVSNPTSGDVPVSFTHPFASVKFKLSAVDGVKEVTNVSLSGVYKSGHTKLTAETAESGYQWEDLGEANAAISVAVANIARDSIATFTVIPKNLVESSVVMTVTYTDIQGNGGKKISKVLNSGNWEAGRTTTYLLSRVEAVEIVDADGDAMTVKNNVASGI